MLAACWQGWNWTRSSGREALITPSTLYNGGTLVQSVLLVAKKLGYIASDLMDVLLYGPEVFACATHAPLSVWAHSLPLPTSHIEHVVIFWTMFDLETVEATGRSKADWKWSRPYNWEDQLSQWSCPRHDYSWNFIFWVLQYFIIS
jgi:hypothetical protein